MGPSIRLLAISALALFSRYSSASSTDSDDDLDLSHTPGTASILHSEMARASNDSLLWGPYNPGLYFGIRPRIPESFRGALIWSAVNEFEDFQHGPRYECRQEDKMKGYGWDEYDIRTGGTQTMKDVENKIDITTEFVKVEGGAHGGSWGVRVRGKVHDDAKKDHKTTVVWHMAHPEPGQVKLILSEVDKRGVKGDLEFVGELEKLGKFKIQVTEGPETNKYPDVKDADEKEWKRKPLDRTIYAGVGLAKSEYWRGQEAFIKILQDSFQELNKRRQERGMSNEDPPPKPWQAFQLDNVFEQGNMHYIQKTFVGNFEFDILFSSGSNPKAMTSELLTEKIKSNHEAFEERFKSVFKRQSPFTDPKYDSFSKSLFSNLLGGIGYFHGDQIIDRSDADAYAEEDENFWESSKLAMESAKDDLEIEGPSELFTSVPSRPFFPRGFLWDEGFHLLPIADWDMDVALQVVKSWYNQMDSDGWIAREQILGAEARARVPPEFRTQYPHHANPPTLIFVLEKLLDKLDHHALVLSANPTIPLTPPTDDLPNAHITHPELAITFLKELYPRLQKNLDWYRFTQSGEITAYNRPAHAANIAFRWRGRTPQHCLASGLDDYPRPNPPHPGELHVDLISWIAVYTRALKRIAAAIDRPEDAKKYLQYEMRVTKNIEALHWNDEHRTFCDATVNELDQSEHLCHRGYVSIFPLLMETLDTHNEKLGKVMELMEDKEELWTEYGLRSLSKQDPMYGTEENYWRGPIWMNINYLAIRALHNYASQGGPYQHRASVLYKKLRKAVVENVYKQWKETGFAWEQYDAATGKGQRTAHFTGWTSLVVEVMGMPDVVGVKARWVGSDDEMERIRKEQEQLGHDEL